MQKGFFIIFHDIQGLFRRSYGQVANRITSTVLKKQDKRWCMSWYVYIYLWVHVRTCSNKQQRSNMHTTTICNIKTKKSMYSRRNWSRLSDRFKCFARLWSKCWRQKEEAMMILNLEKGKQIEYLSKCLHNMRIYMENCLVLSWQTHQQRKEITNACCYRQAIIQITVVIQQARHRRCHATIMSRMMMMYCPSPPKTRIIATRAITS